MNKEKLGNKHLCSNCGTKFFDLRKTIPTCPNCGTEVVIKTKPRLGRPPLNKNIQKSGPDKNIKNEETIKEKPMIEEDDIEINDMDNLVSLEDLESEEEAISDTGENINIISEDNNEENISDITDIDINNEKDEN